MALRTTLVKYVFLLLLAVAITATAVAYQLSRGFSTRNEPSAVKVFAARELRHMAVPGSARQIANQIAATPEVLSEAMEHFADHCAFCDSNVGTGNTPIGKEL